MLSAIITKLRSTVQPFNRPAIGRIEIRTRWLAHFDSAPPMPGESVAVFRQVSTLATTHRFGSTANPPEMIGSFDDLSPDRGHWLRMPAASAAFHQVREQTEQCRAIGTPWSKASGDPGRHRDGDNREPATAEVPGKSYIPSARR